MYKRVEVPGRLLYDLFKEYYKLQQDHIKLKLRFRIQLIKNLKQHIKEKAFKDLVLQKITKKYFLRRITETGFKKGI
jgi:hypothetical protein